MPQHEVIDTDQGRPAWLRVVGHMLLCAAWLLVGNVLPHWFWPTGNEAAALAFGLNLLFIAGCGLLLYRMQETLGVQRAERRRLDRDAELISAELQAIFHATPLAILLIRNRDFVIEQANVAAEQMSGYDAERLAGMSLSDLFDSAEIAAGAARIVPMLLRGETFRDQTVMRRRDGGRVWLNITGRSLDPGQPEQRTILLLEDVGAYREVERRLREAEQRWQFAIEGSGLGVWDWNLAARQAWYSPGWFKMLGYDPAEITGSEAEWRHLVHPDDLPAILAEQSRHFRGEIEEVRCQYRMRKRNGDFLWLLTRGRITGRDARGQPVRMTGANIDISRLKAAEQALWNRERTQRTLMDALPIGMYQIDREGRVVFINETMLRYFGFVEERVVGKPIYELAPHDAEQIARSKEMDRQVMASGEPMNLVEEHMVVDGSRRYFEIGRIPHRNAQGEVIGLHGYIRDITAQHEAEQALRNSERLYRSLGEALPMGLFRIGRDRRIIFANQHMARRMGARVASEVVGRDMFELTPEPDRANAYAQHLRVVEQGITSTVIEPHVEPVSGRTTYLEITRLPVRDESGAITGEQGVFRDVTEQVLFEQQLRLTSLVFESAHQGAVISDSRHRILRVNRGFTRITGYEPEEVIGRFSDMLAGGRYDKAFYRDFLNSLRQHGHWEGETVTVGKDGRECATYITTEALRGADGKIDHYVTLFLDISERKASEEHIRHLAQYDQLTDLPNRTLLRDRVELAIEAARRHGTRFALMFLDLDRFKNINDSLGHGFGDKLLREAAHRLSTAVRASDTVSRHGGDEFIVMLPDVGGEHDVRQIARKLINTIAQPFVIDDKEVILTLSVGISMYPEDGGDIETLLRNADTALYATKDAGRNHYRFYAAEMNTLAAQRLQTENELRRAIERNELFLEYQPQIDLDTQHLVGAEALVRWRHPARGVVSPGEFIPIAEESGLIVEIGNWVMETACRQYVEWLSSGLPVGCISVNVSGHQFRHRDFVTSVLGCLERSGLDATRLELEVTETVIMQGSDQVLAKLNQLEEIGVRLAIDDFGTGYSSLSYLKLFPLDRLKVDQAFVRGLPDDGGDSAIVRAVVGLGHNLDLNVLAEGIETAQQLEFLRSVGCHIGQGYHFARPLSAEAFEKFIRAQLERRQIRAVAAAAPK